MNIKDKIHTIKGIQIIIDRDLAELYEVKTKALNQAVKRNIERFPENFMFQLTTKEAEEILTKNIDLKNRSQIVTSFKKLSAGYLPYAFTEQGVAMLSGVLRSNKAVEVSIKIMEAFVSMRRFIAKNSNLFLRLDNIDKKLIQHDDNFEEIFNALEVQEPKQGIFFDGQIFDAYQFVSKLIKKAKNRIILIDNYVDESVLTLFSKTNAKITIYTRVHKKIKLDVEKFNSQYNNIILKDFHKSHDRFLIIDKEIYHFGASLKDLGKKWCAFSKLNKSSFNLLEKL